MPSTDDVDAATGLVVPHIIAGFPAPVLGALKLLYCPLLSVDDTTRERLLKTYVFIMLPMTVAPFANLVLTLATTIGTDRGFTVSAAAMALAMAVATASWVLIYVHARVTGGVSEWSADAVNLSTTVVITTMAITDVDTPQILGVWTVTQMCLMTHTPRSKYWIGLCYLSYCVAAYNFVVADANRGAVYHASEGTNEYGLPLLVLPGVLDRDMWVKFLYYAEYFIVLFGGMLGVYVRMSQADSLAKQAAATSDIAADIARSLTRYDTAGARAHLAAAQEAADANPEVLGHFETLIANLDAYRPHLPNWVVAEASATADGDDDGADDRDTEPSLDGNEYSMRSHGHDSEGDGSRHSTPMAARSLTDSTFGRSFSPSSGAPHRRMSPGAVVQLVSLAVADLTFAGDAHGPRLQPHLDAAVDLVHRLARTYGAVHSFVGDRVTVSWNAASRVANPQAKAARFLVQLAKHAGDGDLGGGTLATGATASGPATAHVAGLGDQRALFVSARGEWGRELEALRAEAARQGGGLMLCDERTRREAEHSVAMRAQAAVEYAPKPAAVTATPTSLHCLSIPDDGKKHRRRSVSTLATMALPFRVVDDNDDDDCPPHVTPTLLRALGYALLGLRDDGNDEWMYVLEGQDAQSADVKAAEAARLEELQQWVRGQTDTTAALAVLGRVS